jgi:hypothetical protein
VIRSQRRLGLAALFGALLVACGTAPPVAQPSLRAAAPAPAPTSDPSNAPTPADTPTPQAVQATQTTAARQTVQADQAQISNVVADQKLSAQQVASLQQTAVAAQRTVAAQQGEIQAVTANQTASAQQVAAVQQTAVSVRQNLVVLQTAVANLIAAQQTPTPRVVASSGGSLVQAGPPPEPTATKLPYSWYFKRPTETPQLCGPGQGNPCLDTAPNAGTQYVSGHVFDSKGLPVYGIIVQARNDATVLYNSTDTSGYYSIALYTGCPKTPASWDVYIVDGSGSLSSFVKTIHYENCNQAGEFHVDFVQVA